MLIEKRAKYYLKRARASAKEVEFDVSPDLKSKKDVNIDELFPLVIACIADLSAGIVRGEISVEQVKEYTHELYFASKFYDAYFNINIDSAYKDYFYLVGAIAYYLCDQVGSSLVLASKIDFESLDYSVYNLDRLLYFVLNNTSRIEEDSCINSQNELFASQFIVNYNRLMIQKNDLNYNWISQFRQAIYRTMNCRDIFLVDALLAVFILKSHYSIYNMLPMHSHISLEKLMEVVPMNHFVKEMWPAQRYMCKLGLFMGKSGVVQMPTGAGKTKAIAIAIYSAFCSNSARLSVVVAPFRALCREISADLRSDLSFDKNVRITEISDLIQTDYFLEELLNPENKTVVVTTPEKFLYILRQEAGLVDKIGQLIFDEGHLFDDEERGASYELLISSILKNIAPDVQKILISAIIPNVEQINQWLTKGTGVALQGREMSTVDKLPAALRWETFDGDYYCYLYYIDKENSDSYDFFVPRIIDIQPLIRKKREKQRYFPAINFENKEMEETNDMAIACLLKLVSRDNVAIFCGNRASAQKILERILYLNDRGVNVSGIKERADSEEMHRISKLIEKNYGIECSLYKTSKLGIFSHHAGVSDGIKCSVEYALKNSFITNVVCTSTLAQGVNLPIKYLVVSSIYQGGEQIKVRDFHNLIGRTARSGMFTEGTIIFSDPFVFRSSNNKWKWNRYKKLMDPSNSEECGSVLLDIVRPKSFANQEKYRFYKMALTYYDDKEKFDLQEAKVKEMFRARSDVLAWFSHVMKVLGKVESHLAISIADNQNGYGDEFIEELLENTLAASLATETEKEELKQLLIKMCEHIEDRLPDEHSKRSFSKSMLSLQSYISLQNEVLLNDLYDYEEDMVLEFVINMLFKYGTPKKINKLDNLSNAKELAKRWISGKAYDVIYKDMVDLGCQIMRRGKYKDILLEEVASICDSDFGYSMSIVINSICEVLIQTGDEERVMDLIDKLQKLSQCLKYGLSKQAEIFIYEVGINDRFLAQEIAKIIGGCNKKESVKLLIRAKREEIGALLLEYPSVFQHRLRKI